MEPHAKYRLAMLAIALAYPELYEELRKEFESGDVRGPAHTRAAEIFEFVVERYDAAGDQHGALGGVRRMANLLETDGSRTRRLLTMLARDQIEALNEAWGPFALSFTKAPSDVLVAGFRIAIGIGKDEDSALVLDWIKSHDAAGTGAAAPPPVPVGTTTTRTRRSTTGGSMSTRCEADRKGLPDDFDATAYWAEIERRFNVRGKDPSTETQAEAHACYVAGRLVSESYLDIEGPGFDDAFVEAYNAGFEETISKDPDANGDPVTIANVITYVDVADALKDVKGKGDALTWQALAHVSDYVIEREPVDDNLLTKVASGYLEHIARAPSYDSLSLPEIVTEDTAVGELEPQNIRSVGMVYAADQLDRAQLFNAVDRAAEDWMEGVLAVGEPAGRLFDAYVFDSDNRLDASARQIQYKRVLGAGGQGQHGGGDLNTLMLRAFSAVSEWDRRQDLSDYLAGGSRGTAGRVQDEYPRKALRDLAANASLYGWAYTQFAAKRLGNHIRTAVDIIDHPEVQKAYGVQHAWAVVEQIGAMYFRSVPNIAKHRTMASAGNAALDLLATKAKALGASLSTTDLFPRPGSRRPSVFSGNEYRALLRHAENWLAVNGVNDVERQRASEAREAEALPSVPSFSGGSIGGISPESMKQLEQLASQGQVPSGDQLRQMFPNLGF